MDSMLGFKQFVLYEMAKTLSGGRDSKRHIEKYVTLHIGNPDSPLKISRSYIDDGGIKIPKGSQVIPHESANYKGKPAVYRPSSTNKPHISATVVRPNGYRSHHFVPVTAIQTPTENDGKHNYEHAVRALWNFSTKNKNLVTGNDGKLNLDRLNSEVEKSKKDENHPLHHIHSSEDEFGGGVKNSEKAKQTRHLNLQAAAHTVHSLANHEDIRKHFENGREMSVSGSDTAPMTQLYHGERVKNDEERHNKAKSKFDAGERERLGNSTKFPKQYTTRSTRKGDAVVVGGVYISLKQTQAQGSSGGASESSAIIKHSLNEMKRRKKYNGTPEEFDNTVRETHKRLDEMREHMNEGRHKEADKILQGILDNPIWTDHKDINQLHVHMTHESFSGAGKFKRATAREQKETGSRYTSEQGPATHMSTVPLESGKLSKNPESVSDTIKLTHSNIENLIRQNKIGRPTITAGKIQGSKQSAMRIAYKG